jgi:hypothetical protein
MGTPQELTHYRKRFDAGTTFARGLTQRRESAREPTIVGLILPAKICARAFAGNAPGTHEVIWPPGTMHER